MCVPSAFRQFHRWTAVLFVLTVIAATVAAVLEDRTLQWLSYTPLLPLAVLTLSGVQLFFQPWRGCHRRGAPSAAPEAHGS